MNSASAIDVIERRAQWSCEYLDSLLWLRSLPSDCVHCIGTSPPYWKLRDYGIEGQLGLEETYTAYLDAQVELFRECRRVLHPSGVLFLNIGDTYNTYSGNRGAAHSTLQGRVNSGAPKVARGYGLAAKNLANKQRIGIPWRLALALQDDGWWLRDEIIWHKTNGMTLSVSDRTVTAHEQVFLLTKSERYFFDYYPIMEKSLSVGKPLRRPSGWADKESAHNNLDHQKRKARDTAEVTADRRLCRSVWTIACVPTKAAHFATYPPALVRRCVKAGTSAAGVCPHCAYPFIRKVRKVRIATRPGANTKVTGNSHVDGNRDPLRHITSYVHVGWKRGCKCERARPVPALVMDPYAGTGTTLQVAADLGRRAIGCDINPKNRRYVEKRLVAVTPDLFAE